MRVLITGANGFIGKNLLTHLRERELDVVVFTRDTPAEQFPELLVGVDFIFHLAGVNRPENPEDFMTGNKELTEQLCDAIAASGRKIPLIYTSSSQASLENNYGVSKRKAEQALVDLEHASGSPVYIYRLPNVFGKWSRPNYNSAVATFCYNIVNDLPIQINDPAVVLNLVYIDDVIADFVRLMDDQPCGLLWPELATIYTITVGVMADQIRAFKESRTSLVTEPVGTGFVRALYSTYLSFFKPEQFSYLVRMHTDPRGRFVELLKTKDSGQFSFFTAHPGITRGGHYHHSKNEKFLVIQGKARFRFRHIVTDETHEMLTLGTIPQVVETMPGWSHDITNIGDEEMIVMLWANEIFDRQHPDTVAYKVTA